MMGVCDGVFGVSRAEEIAEEYIASTQRRMSQPVSPSSGLQASDVNTDSPTTPKKKKKKKAKERRKSSRPRGKGNSNNISSSDGSDGAEGDISDIGSPLVSLTSKDSPRKKKKGKKLKQNSAALGVTIIPDCDAKARKVQEEKEVHNDESALFSAVTEPTQLLDEDDFTAATKDASSKDEKKKHIKPPKSPKSPRKAKTTKDKTRAKTPEKSRTKTLDRSRSKTVDKKRTKTSAKMKQGSLTRTFSFKGVVDEKKNEGWGRDQTGNKSYMAPELLHLLVDPEEGAADDSEGVGTMPLKKSHSFHNSSGTMSLKKSNSFHCSNISPPTRRSSFGSNIDTHSKLKARALRSKNIQDHTIMNTKNETWEAPNLRNQSWGAPVTPPGGRRASYSPDLLNLYTSPYRAEKPSPQLRRNVKSCSSGESWRNDPKRDRDIPSILFISNDSSDPSFNESWDSTSLRGKETLMDSVKPPSIRARSAGANTRRRRSSATTQKIEKPPQPLRKKEPRRGSANETWDADPRKLGSNKLPLSSGLIDMLGMSPSTKKKSPGRLKKTLVSTPSLKSLKNNLKKLRGEGTKDNTLKAIPML